jgi:hypothetical protein
LVGKMRMKHGYSIVGIIGFSIALLLCGCENTTNTAGQRSDDKEQIKEVLNSIVAAAGNPEPNSHS